ncbi:hypothetical protein AB0M95_23355 [Sphaerisporangium sp. NPDC051017]|uniref:hypothetical protein n=1 Tax=Sphaerisporangium sp. NPDC051017 TaxID=3154636 RepID=UPI003425476D
MIFVVYPLYRVTVGFVLTSYGVGFLGFGVLFNALGWFLVASGLSAMKRSIGPVFGRAYASALVTWAFSFVWFVEFTEFDWLAESTQGEVIVVLNQLSVLATIWLVAEGIIVRASSFGDTSTASSFDVLRRTAVGCSLAVLLLGYIPELKELGLLLAIVWFVGITCFIINLYRSARLPYLSRAEQVT